MGASVAAAFGHHQSRDVGAGLFEIVGAEFHRDVVVEGTVFESVRVVASFATD